MKQDRFNKITSAWIIAILLLFVASVVLGLLLRFNQGTDIRLGSGTFYATLTTHGVTMIGIWAAAGLVSVNHLLQRYMKLSSWPAVFALILTVAGVVMLWASTLVGNFHAAWTFLYPLPFYRAWETWATPLFLYSLVVFGVAWLVWSLYMLGQVFRHYSLPEAFAWPHLRRAEPARPTPPFILITTVSLVGIILSLITAVVLLILLLAEFHGPAGMKSDPLLMKNLTYFFGHTLANEALYLGLAVVYELMPEASGRPKFTTTWYVALGWNFTLVFVLTAFFHHMYMDFVQPAGFQVVGQLASYFASLPAAAVTAFSVAALVYRKKVQWSLTNLLFFVGIAGWLIGGVGAVIDSTISNNIILHNTLWVPAHFHTYNAMGNVLLSVGFFWWVAHAMGGTPAGAGRHPTALALIMAGGLGFVLMFYFGGAHSVPRRYAQYPAELAIGAKLASVAAWFALAYLAGMLAIFSVIIRKCCRVFWPVS